jgi:hypothetical protein
MTSKDASKFDGILESGRSKKPRKQPAPIATTGGPRGGKSSNPAFTQVTIYIRKDTYVDVRKALLDEQRRDFSEFTEDALKKALKSQKSKQSHD